MSHQWRALACLSQTHTHTHTHAELPAAAAHSPPPGPVLVLKLRGRQHDVKLYGGAGGYQVVWFWSSPRLLGATTGNVHAPRLRSAGAKNKHQL